jgi:hypothetical protein
VNPNWEEHRMKKTILYTGRSYEELKKHKDVVCYLCKRKEKSQSAILVNGKPSAGMLLLKQIECRNPKNIFQFLLCEECILLCSALSNPRKTKLRITA